MPFSSRLLLTASLILCLTPASHAQTSTPQQPAAPAITAVAAAERVRFAAPLDVVQLRLDVYDEAGRKVFDTELRGGSVLDWPLQDGQGARLAEGAYLCVVTVKSLTGRLSQRLGRVVVGAQSAAVEPAAAGRLTPQQALAVGPIEDDASLTAPSEADAAVLTTHDGRDGQVTSTTGALTLRTGDLLRGEDKEHVRVTAEGRVGIGTATPEATLDVSGDIRASGTLRAAKGVEFEDGTVLESATDAARKLGPGGEPRPLVDGTGTTNRVTKWINGPAGTIGDAAIYEAGGLSVFGQNAAGQVAPLFGGAESFHVVEVGATASKSPLVLAGGSGSVEFWKDLGGPAGPAAAASFGMARPGTSATNDIVFSTFLSGQGWSERARVTNAGNVGVGTSAPASRLDVAGDINASTQYNIGGQRVLSNPGLNNLFVGVDAGRFNTTGRFNAFFGLGAGAFNTEGVQNAFFGAWAGINNTTGTNNAFFGTAAGDLNTTGFDNAFFGSAAGNKNSTGFANSFFGTLAGINNVTGSGNSFFGNLAGGTIAGEGHGSGTNLTLIGRNTDVGASNLVNATALGAHAFVTQSNSLVLGGINGQNTATADTNVGIGTTAPKEMLHVQGGSLYVGAGGRGVILKSPDGAACRLLSIDNAGAMVLSPTTCP